MALGDFENPNKATMEPIKMNQQIDSPRVRLIDLDGQQVGVVSIEEALARAKEQQLDLVQVTTKPGIPICRIMNYAEFRRMQQHD